MIHYLKLQPEPFKKIKGGVKDIELRLNDGKRQAMKVGDYIQFTCVLTGEKLNVKILNKRVFCDFVSLFNFYDKRRLGYDIGEVANPKDMEVYYDAEKIKLFGAVAIEIELCKI